MDRAALQSEPIPAWAPGRRVGNYSLLAKLATGGMAEIWLARQVGLKGFERVVVVKRIIESLSADPAFVDMFLDEARIAAQLAHPNVVQIFELGEYAGAYYLVMEYLAGEHLATMARTAAKAGQGLSFAIAARLMVDALAGLAHAHTRSGIDGKPLNVVHRDVSPQNVLITFDGQLKLVDFGIARAANRSSQTQGAMVKGKFAYMAPEQARGGAEVDGRADVFAVGAILYELCTRKRMWPFKDQIQIVTALVDANPVPPAVSRNPELPPELGAIIDRAVEKNVARRWPDALAMKAALEDWLKANGGGPSTTELGHLMHSLFAQRITERAKLIEQATRGDFASVEPAVPIKPPTDRSMPGATPFPPMALPPEPEPEAKKRPVALIAGGALAGVAALIIGAAFLLRTPTAHTEIVEVPAQKPPVVPPAAAVPRPSEARVETEPAGALILLDGVEKGKSPAVISGISVGAHQIEARLDGYETLKRTLEISGPGERSSLVLNLVKEKRVGSPPPAARGRLTLSTDPWTRVLLKDKVLGDTPLLDHVLPAGRHRLRLVNEQKKIDMTIEIEVKPGQTTKKVLKL